MNTEIQTERQLKQDYLKTQIIDKEYDPTKFSDFVCAIKPGNFFLLHIPLVKDLFFNPMAPYKL